MHYTNQTQSKKSVIKAVIFLSLCSLISTQATSHSLTSVSPVRFYNSLILNPKIVLISFPGNGTCLSLSNKNLGVKMKNINIEKIDCYNINERRTSLNAMSNALWNCENDAIENLLIEIQQYKNESKNEQDAIIKLVMFWGRNAFIQSDKFIPDVLFSMMLKYTTYTSAYLLPVEETPFCDTNEVFAPTGTFCISRSVFSCANDIGCGIICVDLIKKEGNRAFLKQLVKNSLLLYLYPDGTIKNHWPKKEEVYVAVEHVMSSIIFKKDKIGKRQ